MLFLQFRYFILKEYYGRKQNWASCVFIFICIIIIQHFKSYYLLKYRNGQQLSGCVQPVGLPWLWWPHWPILYSIQWNIPLLCSACYVSSLIIARHVFLNRKRLYFLFLQQFHCSDAFNIWSPRLYSFSLHCFVSTKLLYWKLLTFVHGTKVLFLLYNSLLLNGMRNALSTWLLTG